MGCRARWSSVTQQPAEKPIKDAKSQPQQVTILQGPDHNSCFNQIIRQQPAQRRRPHAEQSGGECWTSQPRPWMRLKATWLDPLRFVLPHSRGNWNKVFLLSLILGDAIWFPMLTYHGGARDKVKYGHRRTLGLSEECSKLRGISWY